MLKNLLRYLPVALLGLASCSPLLNKSEKYENKFYRVKNQGPEERDRDFAINLGIFERDVEDFYRRRIISEERRNNFLEYANEIRDDKDDNLEGIPNRDISLRLLKYWLKEEELAIEKKRKRDIEELEKKVRQAESEGMMCLPRDGN